MSKEEELRAPPAIAEKVLILRMHNVAAIPANKAPVNMPDHSHEHVLFNAIWAPRYGANPQPATSHFGAQERCRNAAFYGSSLPVSILVDSSSWRLGQTSASGKSLHSEF